MQNKKSLITTKKTDAGVVAFPRLSEPRTTLRLARVCEGEAGRDTLKRFVRAVFNRAYGAEINSFCPELLSLARPDGSLCAVAGVRPAAAGPLYAEHYLDAPVESYLASTPRERIVEMGNLAPEEVGQARWLIATLTAYLHAAGYDRVVFTAVPMIFNAFVRMGLQLQVLAPADVSRLPAGVPDRWGSYYRSGPVVCCGDVREGFQLLSSRMDPRRERLRNLWLQACVLGQSSGPFPRQTEECCR